MHFVRKTIRIARLVVEQLPFGKYAIRAGYRVLKRKQQRLATRNLQLYGLSIYNEIHSILSQNEIKYWADFGTLLGIIRDNGPIAHDEDIDFSILSESDFKKIYNLLISHGFSLSHGWTLDGKLTEIAFRKYNINIDFFLNIPNGNGFATYLYIPVTDFIGETLLSINIRERIRPLVSEVKPYFVGNALVNVPTNYAEVLTSTYGNWKIPDKKFDCANCTATCISRMVPGTAVLLHPDNLLRIHLS